MTKLHRRTLLHLTVGAAALPAMPWVARAQAYPTRPITMVVPFPAGGPNDTLARIMAEQMRVSLGQPILIENVAGANGSIGVGRVARAAGDGYTLSLGSISSHVMNGAIYRHSYDLLSDLEPVAPLINEPNILVGNNAVPATSLADLIAWLKANPDRALAATQGVGNMGHLAGILFQRATNTRFGFVPYRGSAPAIQDLVAGQVDIFFDSPVTTLPQIRAGSIRAYAVSAKGRLAAAPTIPTAEEAGLTGFYLSNWRGLWATKGTPKPVITKLNAAVVDALAHPTARARLADFAQEIFPRDQQTPDALAALQRAEIDRWWPIIKEAGIKGE
jgi:tripartite-type tricarboxylate transporter receptor subunit TctC